MLRRLHGDVCRSIFLRATRCEPGLLHAVQSVQGCLPDQLFSLATPAQPPRRHVAIKDCTRHAEVRNSNRRPLEKSPAEAGLREGATTAQRVSLIPSLTQGSSRSRHNGLYQILSRMNKPTGLWVSGPQRKRIFRCRPELRATRSHPCVQRRRSAQGKSRRLDSAAPGRRPVVVLFIGRSAAVTGWRACRWSWAHSPPSTSWRCGHICGLGHSSMRPSWCS